MVRPGDFDRRMPTYRFHLALGAVFEQRADMAAVSHYGDENSEREALRGLAFADMNALARCGFKNQGAPEWLSARNVSLPEAPNKGARQSDGGLCLRLGQTDILVTADPFARGDRPAQLISEWAADPARAKGFDAHREEGFCWFLLLGNRTPELWSRVCSVDMRPNRFLDLDVAQTRAFEMGGVIARADLKGCPAYHMFFDIASSDFLLESVQTMMRGLDGRMVGLAALRSLE